MAQALMAQMQQPLEAILPAHTYENWVKHGNPQDPEECPVLTAPVLPGSVDMSGLQLFCPSQVSLWCNTLPAKRVHCWCLVHCSACQASTQVHLPHRRGRHSPESCRRFIVCTMVGMRSY